jgi:nitrate/nitrite transport system permease protein
MTVTALKVIQAPAPAPTAKVMVLPTPPRPSRQWGARLGQFVARNVVPPVAVLLVLLAIWQVAAGGEGSGLPSPLMVWEQSYELIVSPFFVYGTQDIGLGWRVLTSLERVAYGFGLASVVGVLIGAVIGQSVWMMRGLDHG